MTDYGVIHGRFQPFHNHHLRYFLAARERSSKIIVGITNPDLMLTASDSADLRRSLPASNPLTFFERLLLIRETLFDEGIPPRDFEIVPFPINRPECIESYVPAEAVFYLTIYDNWGKRKREILEDLGLRVDVLWQWDAEDKGITGEEVRRRVCENGDWEALVPSGVARTMKALDLDKKIQFQQVQGRA